MPPDEDSPPELLLYPHSDPATERSEEWLIGQYTVGLSVCLGDDGAPVVHIDGDLEGLRVNVNDNEVFPMADELRRFLRCE